VSWLAALLAVASCAGWVLALALAVSLRRRLSLAADAEHELRGAAAAIGLAAERISRNGATVAFTSLVRLQLDRMAAGLDDLAAARAPRRSAQGPVLGAAEIDAGRLAQVLGNLVANATEHGVGAVDVSTSRRPDAVRIEIRNRNRPRELDGASAVRSGGRGRGLAIAERAARELGGRLSVESHAGETRAELELPAYEAERTPAAAAGAEPPASQGGGEEAGSVSLASQSSDDENGASSPCDANAAAPASPASRAA
jgi:signal transduction histidine kinase